jgi:hypothetical protein
MIWFGKSLKDTLALEEDTEKTKFYKIFGGFALLWFLLLPFFVTGNARFVYECLTLSGPWYSSLG